MKRLSLSEIMIGIEKLDLDEKYSKFKNVSLEIISEVFALDKTVWHDPNEVTPEPIKFYWTLDSDNNICKGFFTKGTNCDYWMDKNYNSVLDVIAYSEIKEQEKPEPPT